MEEEGGRRSGDSSRQTRGMAQSRRSRDALFEVAEEARGKLQEFVAKAQPGDWEAVGRQWRVARNSKRRAEGGNVGKEKKEKKEKMPGLAANVAAVLQTKTRPGATKCRESRSLTDVRKRRDRVRDDNEGQWKMGSVGERRFPFSVRGMPIRGRKMTFRPAIKAFEFNALTRRKVDVNFGRLRARDNWGEVCGAEGQAGTR